MRNILIIISFLFFSHFLIAQSSEWSVLEGAKLTSFWHKQHYLRLGIDTYEKIDQVKPLVLTSFAFIINTKFSKRWDWCIGLSYNAKGFKEIGTFHIDLTSASFTNSQTKHFLGALVGFKYYLPKIKEWDIAIQTLLNPETIVGGSLVDETKELTLSSLALLCIEKPVMKNLSISINPFFETSLMRYNKSEIISRPNIYKPYGYGLMAGIKYSIFK